MTASRGANTKVNNKNKRQMRIIGTFNDIRDAHTYRVTIDNKNGTAVYTVGEGNLYFGAHPVSIETKYDGMDTTIIETSATVNLLAGSLLKGLYSSEATDTTVDIQIGGASIFSGYVEPRAYTQPYSDETNDISLKCIDGLTAMKYHRFRGVKTKGDYLSAMKAVKMSSMRSLLRECISISCGAKPVWYDRSKQPAEGDGLLLDQLMVNEALYLGDSYTETKTCYEVVEDMLKYLGLVMMETMGGVFVYSIESLGKTINWQQIAGTVTQAVPGWQWNGGELTASHLFASDANVDIGEVFNQVQLTVSPKSSSTVIRSPLDGGGTVPSMGAKVTYMTEYAADGEGKRAARAFWSLVKNHKDNGYGGGQVWKDFVVRPMRNIYWKIGSGKGPGSSCTEWTASTPEALVDRLMNGRGAQLLSIGAIDHKPGTGDSSKQTTISMSNNLVLSVNGNGDDTTPSPTDEEISAVMPVASYSGGGAATIYSPTDRGTRNYLVFAGSLLMTPRMYTPFQVDKVRVYDDGDAFYNGYKKDNYPNMSLARLPLSPSRNNGDGRYLAFEWWKKGKAGLLSGWMPNTDDGPQEYEYKTSNGVDKVEKFDVLWCMLRIGDKVLVEDKTKAGELSAFSWQSYKTLADCGGNADTWLEQTFTIGVDPKIGDKMIGQEFEIGTNFDYNTNIDADGGMAIPLPYDAHLHGELHLDILGVDNGPWENYHKTRSGSMFRHSKWGTDTVPLMAHVGSVIIKNFSVKFYSDGTDSEEDDDIIYVSRATTNFINKKELQGSMIHSGFTTEESNQYNLKNKVLQSSVCDAQGNAVLTVKDANTGQTDKPEKLRVDELWRRYHQPRLSLTQTVGPALVSPWAAYPIAALGITAVVESQKIDLADGENKVKFVEI